MNKTELLEMALEKLTAASNYIDTLGGVSKGYRMDIERLKAALEAKDEPDWKALVLNHNADCESRCDMERCKYKPYFEHNGRRCPDCPVHETIDVEYTPPQQEAKDEPVAWMYDWTTSEGEFIQNWTTSEAETLRDTEPTIITNVRPLYTTPPQRKPLTVEEIHQIFIANSVVVDNGNAYMVAGLRTVNIARAIEAAHGIKGEA